MKNFRRRNNLTKEKNYNPDPLHLEKSCPLEKSLQTPDIHKCYKK
jgi:hypothetical protein